MTVEDAQVVHDYLKPFVDDGHIRAFTGNEYLQDFGSGDTWAAIVWSGDLASSAGPDDVFVFPEEGSMIWTDNMLIPKGAENKYTAELMIDWVYDVDPRRPPGQLHLLHQPGQGRRRGDQRARPRGRDEPAAVPAGRRRRQAASAAELVRGGRAQINELFADLPGV